MDPTRRSFCLTAASAALGAALGCSRRSAAAGASTASAEPEVTVVEFSRAGVPTGTVQVSRIVKSDDEWRRQLSPAAYNVTREEGTEMAFSGRYWNLHEAGLYRCICCDTALFSSDTKFESGTGWPSFWAPIAPENVREHLDRSFGMDRTAVSCTRCGGHLGHVFDDGPKPTGLRYCMNSVAMKFVRFA